MKAAARPISFLLLVAAASCSAPAELEQRWVFDPVLEPQASGASAPLIAASVVNRDTVWVSGRNGTFARTTDGGSTWAAGTVPGADSLQFRDVHAANGSVAWLLSIGNGTDSRIYRTIDAGANWTLQFTNTEPDAFFDCFDFWDDRSGIAFSDSYDGSFNIITTTDGGDTWTRIDPGLLPAAHQNEGSFASSGTCLITVGDSTALIGTGASTEGSRVLSTRDRGATWTVVDTDVIAGSAAGIATLAFRDPLNGSAIGGDIGAPGSSTENVALTTDGGRTWSLAQRTPFAGPAYGSAWVPDAPQPTLVAVGPGGLAVTFDDAVTWTVLDTLNHWGISFAAPDAGWAVGPAGRITRLRLYRHALPER